MYSKPNHRGNKREKTRHGERNDRRCARLIIEYQQLISSNESYFTCYSTGSSEAQIRITQIPQKLERNLSSSGFNSVPTLINYQNINRLLRQANTNTKSKRPQNAELHEPLLMRVSQNTYQQQIWSSWIQLQPRRPAWRLRGPTSCPGRSQPELRQRDESSLHVPWGTILQPRVQLAPQHAACMHCNLPFRRRTGLQRCTSDTQCRMTRLRLKHLDGDGECLGFYHF